MGTRERPAERGTARGRRLLLELAREFGLARRRAGLSLRAVADSAGVSVTAVWRFEHGHAPGRGRRRRRSAARDRRPRPVGAGVSRRPTGSRRRADSVCSRPSTLAVTRRLGWATEVPLPIARRPARDGTGCSRGPAWRYGCEAEMGPERQPGTPAADRAEDPRWPCQRRDPADARHPTRPRVPPGRVALARFDVSRSSADGARGTGSR